VLLFFPALGLATGAAAALFAAMTAFGILSVIELLHPAVPRAGGDAVSVDSVPYRRRAAAIPTAAAAILVVACTGVGLATDHFDEAHPRPTQLMYALDADTGQAYWASEQDSARGWLATFVNEKKDLSDEFPLLADPLLTGPAQPADLPAPTLGMGRARVNADGTTSVDLNVRPQRPVRLVELTSPDTTVLAATVTAGGVSRTVELVDGPFDLLFHAPPADGIVVHLTVADAHDMTFRVVVGSDGLSDLPGFVPRPADVGVKGSHTSELVLVATTVGLTVPP
jgi:hypothetical protein